jgi:hypothetical protein
MPADHKTPLLSQLFLRLSRACLGKKIVFSSLDYKMAPPKRRFCFRTEVCHDSDRLVRGCGGDSLAEAAGSDCSTKRISLFSNFSYACPEPVLAKSSLLA